MNEPARNFAIDKLAEGYGREDIAIQLVERELAAGPPDRLWPALRALVAELRASGELEAFYGGDE